MNVILVFCFNNDVKEFIKDEFDFIEKNILVVNDLWNPDINDLETYGDNLMISKTDEIVLDFVKENTKIFDESHNWEHAVKIAINSNKLFVKYLARII